MLRQQFAERPTAHTDVPSRRRTLPQWNVTLRRLVTVVLDRTLGECWAPTPTRGVLVLLTIVSLLAIIAVTLSVGNAALVLLAAVAMRITCERRRPKNTETA